MKASSQCVVVGVVVMLVVVVVALVVLVVVVVVVWPMGTDHTHGTRWTNPTAERMKPSS